MYTIQGVVRRDVAGHFGVAGKDAREQVNALIGIVTRNTRARRGLNVEKALKISGWIVAPDSHPGYDWDGEDEIGRVMQYAQSTNVPVVAMHHRDTAWPWWYMAEPGGKGPAADLVREIIADVMRIKESGNVFQIPGSHAK